jgi:hypothetical protein
VLRSFAASEPLLDVAVYDASTAYVVTDKEVVRVDISNPAAPAFYHEGLFSQCPTPRGVHILNSTMTVGCGTNGAFIMANPAPGKQAYAFYAMSGYDVSRVVLLSNGATAMALSTTSVITVHLPSLTATYFVGGSPRDAVEGGGYVYVTDPANGMSTFSMPTNGSPTSSRTLVQNPGPQPTPSLGQVVYANGVAYAADGFEGLRVTDYTGGKPGSYDLATPYVSGPDRLAAGGGRIYARDFGAGIVPLTLRALSGADFGAPFGDQNPTSGALAGGFGYLSSPTGIVAFDATQAAPVPTAAFDARDSYLAAVPGRLFAYDFNAAQLVSFSLAVPPAPVVDQVVSAPDVYDLAVDSNFV